MEEVCMPPADVEVCVVVVVRVVVLVWVPPADGVWAAPPADEPCEAPPDGAPWEPPAAPPDGFEGALAGAAGLAGALGGVVALAILAIPTNAARIAAAEPFFMALQRICVVIISSFLFEARALFVARTHYSTLLTFPFVKVTFMSL